MEFPYCSPNYHLYTFNDQATGVGHYSPPQRPCEAETLMLPSLSVKVINPNEAKLFILRKIIFRCFDQPESVRKMLISELADEISNE